jgi:hypothetical protein
MSRNLILGALVAAATFGCATTQNPTTAAAHVASNSGDKSAGDIEHCVRDTGTYIRRADKDCANRPGSSYSQQELEDTGRFSTDEALRQLDPRVQ